MKSTYERRAPLAGGLDLAFSVRVESVHDLMRPSYQVLVTLGLERDGSPENRLQFAVELPLPFTASGPQFTVEKAVEIAMGHRHLREMLSRVSELVNGVVADFYGVPDPMVRLRRSTAALAEVYDAMSRDRPVLARDMLREELYELHRELRLRETGRD